jgi:hypothetical protein
MIRKLPLFLLILLFPAGYLSAQSFIKTSDLFKRSDDKPGMGKLNIYGNPSVDTLISRYIMMNENLKAKNGYYGMEGFRIQIYASSNRNAREESSKAYQDFINKFPDIKSYSLFAQPGYYKIRAGDFRTRTEALKLFQEVSREFPEAYIVPDFINFPDKNIK